MSYVNHCLVCEDLRPELGGKASLLGFLGVLPYVNLWIGDIKFPVRQLILLFTFSPQNAVFRIRPQVISPDGTRLLPEEDSVSIQFFADYPSNTAISLGGIVFPVVGKYKVELYVDEVLQFSESMQVREGPAPATHTPRYIGAERMISTTA